MKRASRAAAWLMTMCAGAALAQPAEPPAKPEAPAAAPPATSPPATSPPPRREAPQPKIELDTPGLFAGVPVMIDVGYRFTEGPVWVPARDGQPGFFLFCSFKGDGGTVYRWDGLPKDAPEAAKGPKPTEFIRPSGRALGLALDDKGQLLAATVEGRSIVRFAWPKPGSTDGQPVTIADKFEGKRLNDTNDLVVDKDGSVYFTDPRFFTKPQDVEQPKNAVYRLAPDGAVTKVADVDLPNGIALASDGRTLYVNNFSKGQVLAMTLDDKGAAGPATVLADLAKEAKDRAITSGGGADGLRVDAQGRLWTTGRGCVWVLSPGGEVLALISNLPASNLALGGEDGKTVFFTQAGAVWYARLK
jgi:sugar lactone lactonase YvrE